MARKTEKGRVDKHFVPDLIVNGELLERLDGEWAGATGIMVGVDKTYVEGKYMKQKAIGRYKTVVRTELDKRVREVFK